MTTILILNLFSSFFLCGLIWTIQLVHYPMFYSLETMGFSDHMNTHKMRIALIVVPVMLAELGSSVWLTIYADLFWEIHTAGLILVLLIWLVTFFVQVPAHSRLSEGKDEVLIRKLVNSNWLRTGLWTLKSILGFWLLIRIL